MDASFLLKNKITPLNNLNVHAMPSCIFLLNTYPLVFACIFAIYHNKSTERTMQKKQSIVKATKHIVYALCDDV